MVKEKPWIIWERECARGFHELKWLDWLESCSLTNGHPITGAKGYRRLEIRSFRRSQLQIKKLGEEHGWTFVRFERDYKTVFFKPIDVEEISKG